MNTDFNRIWLNILAHQNEKFFTTTKASSYSYVVKNDYVHIKEVFNFKKNKVGKGCLIPREYFEKAYFVVNPIPQTVHDNGVKRGPSYICGIITDDRIKNG